MAKIGVNTWRRRARIFRLTGAAAIALGLSSCAVLAPPPQSFDLKAAEVKAHPFQGRIFVAAPSAVPPLDGDLIVVRGADGGLSRVPGARWADRLPALLQSRVAQTFENAGLARQVAMSLEGADYSLGIEIRSFDIDAANRTANVELTGRLVSQAGGRVVAARVFSSSAPVADISGAAAAQALNGALASVLAQIVAWTISTPR